MSSRPLALAISAVIIAVVLLACTSETESPTPTATPAATSTPAPPTDAGATPAPTAVSDPFGRTGSLVADPGVRAQGVVPLAWPLPDGSVRLYYCGGGGPPGIVSALSEDGLNFTPEQGSRVELAGQIACDPSIVEADEGLRMYFKEQLPQAPGEPPVHIVWSAVSSDGLNWQVEEQRLALEEECSNFVSVPSAVALPDGRVRLYFVCNAHNSAIASAISDDGLNFVFEGILLEKAVDPDVHLLSDGTYRLFYTVWNASDAEPVEPTIIGTATSKDGLNWNLEGVVADAGDFGLEGLVDPSALSLPDGSYRIYAWDPTDEDVQMIVSAVWHPPAR